MSLHTDLQALVCCEFIEVEWALKVTLNLLGENQNFGLNDLPDLCIHLNIYLEVAFHTCFLLIVGCIVLQLIIILYFITVHL